MSWAECVPDIQRALNDKGKQFIEHPEVVKILESCIKREKVYYGAEGWEVTFKCKPEVCYGSYNLQLSLDVNNKNGHFTTLFQFNLSYYQACCAMYGLNNFQYHSSLSAELVAALADYFIQKWEQVRGNLQRVLINFVSAIIEGEDDSFLSSSVIKPEYCDKPNFAHFYEWAKKHPKFQEMLFYNSNSGNIIRCCEVVLH